MVCAGEAYEIGSDIKTKFKTLSYKPIGRGGGVGRVKQKIKSCHSCVGITNVDL